MLLLPIEADQLARDSPNNLIRGRYCSKPYSKHGDHNCDDSGQDYVLSPPVDHLSSQNPGNSEKEPCRGRRFQINSCACHNISKCASHEEQIKIDECQEDDSCPWRNQLVAQAPKDAPSFRIAIMALEWSWTQPDEKEFQAVSRPAQEPPH